APRDQLLFGDAVADDVRGAHLAPALVRHTDHGGVRHSLVLVQHRLDLGRVHVLAAGDVHVLQPATDAVEALAVFLGDVAGAEPPVVGEHGRRRLGIAPVAGEDVGAGDELLPLGRQRDVDAWMRHAYVFD